MKPNHIFSNVSHFNFITICIVLSIAETNSAHAYIDPGIGSILIQVIFAGDHGTQITRGAKHTVPYEDLDSYGIGIGVSPIDFCSENLKEGVWIDRLMELIVTCLSQDKNPYKLFESSKNIPEDIRDVVSHLYPTKSNYLQ